MAEKVKEIISSGKKDEGNTKGPKGSLDSRPKGKKIEFRDMFLFFTLFFYCCFLINFLFACVSHGNSFGESLYYNGRRTDLFMDFFNSMRDASNSDVYTGRNNIYPPLSLLIFKFLDLFVDPQLVKTTSEDKVLMELNQRTMMIFFLFAIICVIFTVRVLNAYLNTLNLDKKTRSEGRVLIFLLLLSYPMIFGIERGNIVLLCYFFTAYFVFFYKSENKLMRELSYVSLAIAAGIKIYPAFFGLLLLYDKRWKDAGKTILYGIIAFAVPALFFIHPSSLFEAGNVSASHSGMLAILGEEGNGFVSTLIQNIITFTTKRKSVVNLSSVSIENIIFLIAPGSVITANIVMVSFDVIAALMIFLAKKDWQKSFLICYMMLNIPAASTSYAIFFLVIPFLQFMFGEKEHTRIDWLYLVLFTLLFVPLPTLWYFNSAPMKELAYYLGIKYNAKLNQILGTPCVQAMFVSLVIQLMGSSEKKEESSMKILKKSKKSENSEKDEKPAPAKETA